MATMIKDSTGKWVTVAGGHRMWVGTKKALNNALQAGEIEDGVEVMVTDDYAENSPVGVIQAYMGTTTPQNWLLCDGSAFDKDVYPELYEILGSETLPDLRESVLVGAGQNENNSIATHDVYTVGQFKDDQLQSHIHTLKSNLVTASGFYAGGAGGYTNTGSNTGNQTNAPSSGRIGDVTHGKQTGVNFIIRAV